MAEFSALPLFTDSLIADTDHLTHEEFGAYLRILVLLWRTPDCRMPCADAWLMRKLKADAKQFKELFKPLFSEFLTSDGSYFTQKRLSKEFAYVRAKRLKNRGAAKSRWNKEKIPHSGNAPTPSPTPSNREVDKSTSQGSDLFKSSAKPKKFDPKTMDLPAWLTRVAWENWADHRANLKKPLTEKAATLCLDKLLEFRAKGHDPIAVINASIMSGWQGLFELKPSNGRASGKPSYSDDIQSAMSNVIQRQNEEDASDAIS